MRYGFVLPYGDVRVAADFAYEAEQAGRDGFFVWEPVWGIDAWVSLAAAAMRTPRGRCRTTPTRTPSPRLRGVPSRYVCSFSIVKPPLTQVVLKVNGRGRHSA